MKENWRKNNEENKLQGKEVKKKNCHRKGKRLNYIKLQWVGKWGK